MLEFLRARDVGAVFRFLRSRGWSRAAIAAATGLSETRVRQIAQGRQRITSYEVLERIADGLDIDRGWMGLAYTAPRVDRGASSGRAVDHGDAGRGEPPRSGSLPTVSPVRRDSVEGVPDDQAWEDPMRRRQFVSALAGVAVGSVTAGDLTACLPPSAAQMTAPDTVTGQHVTMVRRITELHRTTDLRAGGGAVCESATGYLTWANGLLRAQAASDTVAVELRAALGYLHNVAGWVTHDLGRHGEARRHLTRGLLLAREIDEHALMADAYYKLGRVSIDQGHTEDALRLWQIGQLVARQAGSPASAALLYANEAWAYGLLGDARLMADALARAETELGRTEVSTVPRWCRFFTHPGELLGMRYAAYGAIARHREHRRYAARAVEAAEQAARTRRPGEGRSFSFDLIAAATGHLLDGNLDQAARNAHHAVDRTTRLRSARPRTRLAQWADSARPHAAGHSDLADAVHRAAALSAI